VIVNVYWGASHERDLLNLTTGGLNRTATTGGELNVTGWRQLYRTRRLAIYRAWLRTPLQTYVDVSRSMGYSHWWVSVSIPTDLLSGTTQEHYFDSDVACVPFWHSRKIRTRVRRSTPEGCITTSSASSTILHFLINTSKQFPYLKIQTTYIQSLHRFALASFSIQISAQYHSPVHLINSDLPRLGAEEVDQYFRQI